MKKPIDKTRSKYQKKINILIAVIATLTKKLNQRKIFAARASAFNKKMLHENRVTRDELKEYFINVPK